MYAFWAQGFEATGIAELETATGLRRQSLYGAFGDKRALFLKVVDFYFERVLQPGVIDVLDAPGSARANMDRIFAQWQELATSPDFTGCLVGNAMSDLRVRDEQMADLLGRKLRLMEDAFARAIRRAAQDGEVPCDIDPRATARTLVAIGQGLAVVARVQKDCASVRAVLDGARRLLD